jgi:hypothetical protein
MRPQQRQQQQQGMQRQSLGLLAVLVQRLQRQGEVSLL